MKFYRSFLITTNYIEHNCRHSEHALELFYLQTGGNMMEYPAWKKKQPSATPQFQNFLKSYQLDAPPPPATPLSSSSSLESAAVTATTSAAAVAALKIASFGQQQQHQHQRIVIVDTAQPHGAEIKIPGVGATPVAVSTTLPAAVAQLSQQGKTYVKRFFVFLAFYFCQTICL